MMKYMLAAMMLFYAAGLQAQQSVPPAPYANTQLENAAQERDARALMQTLRCLTCQSQSIADSDAPMAADMRHEVRTRIAAGESPDAIRAWLVERYGDWISYEPAVSAVTWPLWALPLILIVVAAFLLRGRFRRKREAEDGG